MNITKVQIRHFRSIYDITINFDKINLLTGPNSCGKSNIIRAIQFAFKEKFTKEIIYENLYDRMRNRVGGPTLSIYVNITFSDLSPDIKAIAELGEGEDTVEFKFRAYRGGRIDRQLGNVALTDELFDIFQNYFSVIYVPPIRDILTDGLKPFRELFARTLRKTRGARSLNQLTTQVTDILQERARSILSEQALQDTLRDVQELVLDTSTLSLEGVYENLGVLVKMNEDRTIPLEGLGTGHQSLVVMQLYEKIGNATGGSILYCFEEPDNHLHSTTIRHISNYLKQISSSNQVIVTTHSPILINEIGVQKVRALYLDQFQRTKLRDFKLHLYTDGELRNVFQTYGIKASEPLFCKKVILVEGVSDVTVLSKLIYEREGKTPEQLDILIFSCNGKSGIVEMAKLIEALSVPWVAIFDKDAVFGHEVPMIRENLAGELKLQGIQSLDCLLGMLDLSRKRGKNAKKLLVNIKKELEEGSPERTYLDGTNVEKIINLKNRLSEIETSRYRDLIRRNVRVAEQREILKKSLIVVWKGSIEDVLLEKQESLNVVERVLIEVGKIPHALNVADKREELKNILHNSASEPRILNPILTALEEERMFRRSEINEAIKLILAGVL